MPLIAEFDGHRLESWAMPADRWTTLKSEYKTTGLTMSCGEPGYPKTSALGTQFFAHKANANCQAHEGGPETQEHLRGKAIVAEVARALGWTATVEYPGPDRRWIADVLIEKGKRRIAIEVQWSSQSAADFERRQARYMADGVECWWLAGSKNSKTAGTVPSYSITGAVDELRVTVPTHIGISAELELRAGVTHILDQNVVQRIEPKITGLTVSATAASCWRYMRPITYWFVLSANLETRCGDRATVYMGGVYESWLEARFEGSFHTQIREHLTSIGDVNPAKYDRRHTKATNAFYIGQICTECEVVQGDGLIDLYDGQEISFPVNLRYAFPEQILGAPHACTDVGRGLCHQSPAPAENLVDSSRWSLTRYEA